MLIFSLLIGLGACAIGVMAFVIPRLASRMFGLATEGSGAHWVQTAGTRDIFLGLTYLILWWHDERLLLGQLSLAASVIAFGDCYLTRRFGSHLISATHFAGALALVLYGWILIRY